jgi:hypothetical protein
MIRDKTRKQYNSIINRYSFLEPNDPTIVINYVSDLNLSNGSKKNIICAFKWAANRSEYSDEIIRLSQMIAQEKERYTNKFPKLDMTPINIRSPIDNLIYNLYTKFPPRRLSDYSNMIYIADPMSIDKGGQHNYVIESDRKFLFQNYKTCRSFGIQTFQIPDNLWDAIDRYIDEAGISYGDHLLKFGRGKATGDTQSLASHLKRIFGGSVDAIRHAYITRLYRDPAAIYNIEDISLKMGHKIDTHIGYLDARNNIE